MSKLDFLFGKILFPWLFGSLTIFLTLIILNLYNTLRHYNAILIDFNIIIAFSVIFGWLFGYISLVYRIDVHELKGKSKQE